MKRILLYLLLITFITSCDLDDLTENDTSSELFELEGQWHCEEQSEEFGPTNYYVTIDADEAYTNTILIYNFYQLNPDSSVYATVSGKNLTIPEQIVDNWMISGSGQISSNNKQINITHQAEGIESKKSGKALDEEVSVVYTKI